MARRLLLVAGLLCLVGGLLPGYAESTEPDGTATETLRLGPPSSPVFGYERASFDSADISTTLGDGTRIDAKSTSGYRWEWRIDVFTWSMALVGLGVALVVASFVRRRPAGPRTSPDR